MTIVATRPESHRAGSKFKAGGKVLSSGETIGVGSLAFFGPVSIIDVHIVLCNVVDADLATVWHSYGSNIDDIDTAIE